MKKIGGVSMNAVARLKGKLTRVNTSERNCNIYEALKESLKEVKLHKAGKIKLDTWDEFKKELDKD